MKITFFNPDKIKHKFSNLVLSLHYDFEEVYKTTEIPSNFFEFCPDIIVLITTPNKISSYAKCIRNIINKSFVKILFHCPEFKNPNSYSINSYEDVDGYLISDTEQILFSQAINKIGRKLSLELNFENNNNLSITATQEIQIKNACPFSAEIITSAMPQHNDKLFLSESVDSEVDRCARIVSIIKEKEKTLYEVVFAGVPHE